MQTILSEKRFVVLKYLHIKIKLTYFKYNWTMHISQEISNIRNRKSRLRVSIYGYRPSS